MLDYHADRVGLNEFTAELSAASFADPGLAAAQAESLSAVTAETGAALLGAFVHQLLAQAASDGSEVALLGRAADLWSRGVGLCNDFASIRAGLEGALENPGAAGSAAQFDSATVNAQELAHSANAMRLEIDALRSDVLSFRHLPPHPRQEDLTTNSWDWADLTVGRRTDAFVRALFRRAADPRSVAFAVGTAAAYGTNAAGSAYVGHAVGGPRRSHRYRDRIARNAVGSWLATHHPAAESPTAMATEALFGSTTAPELPDDLERLVTAALFDTFDTTRTLPLPDLQLGYRRLIQHLNLLDQFSLPPVPTPPGQVWMATLYADPGNPPPMLRPQDVNVVGQDGGGVGVKYGSPEPGSGFPDGSDTSDTSKACGILVLIVIVIDLVQAFIQCIGQWASHHTCTFWDNMILKKLWEQDPPDPTDPTHPQNPSSTSAQLTAIATSPQAAQLVGMLFDAHSMAWEAMSRAFVFLAISGLIYPAELVSMPVYAQFTSLPGSLPWPHREEANPAANYHRYPTSSLEHPTTSASPFPAEAPPLAFLGHSQPPNGTEISLEVWRQIAGDLHDTANLDLDADRGFGYPCWAATGSVHDDPVAVLTLGYDEQ